jgi:hypothetical protein
LKKAPDWKQYVLLQLHPCHVQSGVGKAGYFFLSCCCSVNVSCACYLLLIDILYCILMI